MIAIKHPGSLKVFGYSPDEPERKRRTALREACKHYGKDEVIRKLNAVAVLTKNRQPQNSAIYERDMEAVRKMRV